MKKKDVFAERKLRFGQGKPRTFNFLGKVEASSSNHTRNGGGNMGL